MCVLLGKYSLLPFGFHCTGMPIKAFSDKLAIEVDNGIITGITGRSAKASAKAKQGVSQFDFFHMGVKEEEIPEFRSSGSSTSHHSAWMISKPMALPSAGTYLSSRPSSILISVVLSLSSYASLRFSTSPLSARPLWSSLKDQQPCMDHGFESSEGVQPQEYNLIRLHLIDPQKIYARCRESHIFFLAATLRPETMIG